MELKDFIAQALTDIAEGVAKGAEAVAALGGVVNPSLNGAATNIHHSSRSSIINIEFTVGLSANEGDKSKGGIGVVFGIVSLGGHKETDQSSASTTSLKFHVPMVLPRAKTAGVA